MSRTLTTLTLIATLCTSAAYAKCASKAPSVSQFKSAAKSGDQAVNASWMKKNLVGKIVSYGKIGAEYYLGDGTYFYKTNEQTFTANGYTFYNNGLRCLNYPRGPRYDAYVVNGGKLTLINAAGERYIARVKKLQ